MHSRLGPSFEAVRFDRLEMIAISILLNFNPGIRFLCP